MLEELRSKYAGRVEELPFQEIGDTPTVRFYTDWRVYEERMRAPEASSPDELPGIYGAVKPAVTLYREPEIGPGLGSVEARPLGFGGSWDGLEPMSIVGVNTKMQALHASRVTTGLTLRARDGGDFGKLVLWSHSGEGYLGHHVTLEIGEESRGEIVIVDYGGPRSSLKTLVVEGVVGRGAEVGLHYMGIHSRNAAAYVLLALRLMDGASVRASNMVLGGAMTRFQADYLIEGSGARLECLSGNIGRRGTKSDVILNAINIGPKSTGLVSARGAVLAGGYLVQRGLAKLSDSAKWASSEVESHLLVLGEKAKGYAVPMLEIFTGDVTKAGHSASVTDILEEHMFYLRSRGLSREDIERLIVESILEYPGLLENLNLTPHQITELMEL